MIRMLSSVGTAMMLSSAVAGNAAATEFSGLLDRARDACASQIDTAFNILATTCTAAAVLDMATSPDDPYCTAARGITVEYLKACVAHAAALLREGDPVSLPPFPSPDLSGTILAEGAMPQGPAPVDWPTLSDEELASLAAAIAEMKHEMLQVSAGEQMRILIARAVANTPELILIDEPTAALSPRDAADDSTTSDSAASSTTTTPTSE